ncbi:MAG: hypothetical protein SNJ62_00320 [Chloracidobacterium sp.]
MLMTSLKLRAAAAATRFALRYPRLTWWAARRIAPLAAWLLRRFRRFRPAPEAHLVAELTQELKQATVGGDIDWQDVHTLGELCIRQRDYAGAAQHFQRIAAAAAVDRELVDRELQRSAASWLGRALEYAGDTQGARVAYYNYLRDFPEISSFERQRLERRLADLSALPRALDAGAVNDRLPLATASTSDDRPSRISVGRRTS